MWTLLRSYLLATAATGALLVATITVQTCARVVRRSLRRATRASALRPRTP